MSNNTTNTTTRNLWNSTSKNRSAIPEAVTAAAVSRESVEKILQNKPSAEKTKVFRVGVSEQLLATFAQ